MSEGLPEGWASATIEDCAASEPGAITDGPYGSNLKSSHYTAEGPKVIRLGNILPGRIDMRDDAHVSRDHFESLERHHVRPGDVVMAGLGDPIGRAGLIPDDIGEAMVKADCFRIRTGALVEPPFLVAWLNSPAAREGFVERSHGLGRMRVNLGDVKSSAIPVPPLPEQRRIVAKLDRLSARTSAARRHLARVAALAARGKQAILAAEAVVPWSSDNSQEISIEDIAVTTFDGPFGSKLKTEDYTSDGVRVIRLENIGPLSFREDRISYVSEEKFSELSRHTLSAGDIIFSSFIDDQIRVCRIPDELDGRAINKADCFCVRVDETICDPAFLLYRLGSRQTFEDLEQLVHGATRPRIGLKNLKAYRIALPPLSEQRHAVRRIEAAFARIDRLADESARAARLLDRLDERLLARAFRGELVPQDPADEPAAALLARLRETRAAAPKPGRGRQRKGAA